MSKNPFGFTLDPRHVLRYGTVMKHPTKAKASKIASTKQIQYKGVSIYSSDNGYRVSIDRDSLFDSVKDAKQFVDRWKRNPGFYGVIRTLQGRKYLMRDKRSTKDLMRLYADYCRKYGNIPLHQWLVERGKVYKEIKDNKRNPATKKSAADFQQSYTDHLEIVSSPEFSNATLKQKALMLTGVDMKEKLGNPRNYYIWKQATLQRSTRTDSWDVVTYGKRGGLKLISNSVDKDRAVSNAARKGYKVDNYDPKPIRSIDTSSGTETLIPFYEYMERRKNPFLTSAIEGLATGTGITLGASLMAPVVARSVKKALKGISNPSIDDAASLSTQFHGRPATEILEVTDTFQSRTNLTMLGCLVELELLCDNRSVIPLDFKTSKEKEMVYLASDPAGNQLYIVGGNQSLPLDEIETVDPSELEKDFVTVGVVHSCSYYTDKHHLAGPASQKDGEVYWHVFAEDGGEKPVLVFDKLNKQLQLVGGSYKVKDVGIVN